MSDELAEAAEYVAELLDRADSTARPDWKHNVLGTTFAAAMTNLPPRPALCLRMPREQYLISVGAGRRRGLGPSPLLRVALGTMLVADGVPSTSIEWMLQDGTWR